MDAYQNESGYHLSFFCEHEHRTDGRTEDAVKTVQRDSLFKGAVRRRKQSKGTSSHVSTTLCYTAASYNNDLRVSVAIYSLFVPFAFQFSTLALLPAYVEQTAGRSRKDMHRTRGGTVFVCYVESFTTVLRIRWNKGIPRDGKVFGSKWCIRDRLDFGRSWSWWVQSLEFPIGMLSNSRFFIRSLSSINSSIWDHYPSIHLLKDSHATYIINPNN